VIADQEYALTLYSGYMTKEVWFNTISHDTVFAHANIVVVAASWTFSQWWHGKLAWELEGQVGKYFGAQENWEFNLPIVSFRWHPFPWDPLVDTSFAWGIGPSYATREPEVEIDISDETSQWLIYWYGEVTFGPPAASWEVLFRLHHRSGGFGLVTAGCHLEPAPGQKLRLGFIITVLGHLIVNREDPSS
jgi:hypothetical protein